MSMFIAGIQIIKKNSSNPQTIQVKWYCDILEWE